MADDSWTWLKEQTIPSDTAAGRAIMSEILAQLTKHQWSEQEVFSVHLALEEALVNAIKHGNQLAADKQVHLICKVSKEKIWIQITDEGEGFDPEEVPDPTMDSNLEKTSGRGIMLMKNFMTIVEFSESGKRVVMSKQRSDTTGRSDTTKQ